MTRFEITTDAINEQGQFDPRYTCDLDNSSPELRWEGSRRRQTPLPWLWKIGRNP